MMCLPGSRTAPHPTQNGVTRLRGSVTNFAVRPRPTEGLLLAAGYGANERLHFFQCGSLLLALGCRQCPHSRRVLEDKRTNKPRVSPARRCGPASWLLGHYIMFVIVANGWRPSLCDGTRE